MHFELNIILEQNIKKNIVMNVLSTYKIVLKDKTVCNVEVFHIKQY